MEIRPVTGDIWKFMTGKGIRLWPDGLLLLRLQWWLGRSDFIAIWRLLPSVLLLFFCSSLRSRTWYSGLRGRNASPHIHTKRYHCQLRASKTLDWSSVWLSPLNSPPNRKKKIVEFRSSRDFVQTARLWLSGLRREGLGWVARCARPGHRPAGLPSEAANGQEGGGASHSAGGPGPLSKRSPRCHLGSCSLWSV